MSFRTSNNKQTDSSNSSYWWLCHEWGRGRREKRELNTGVEGGTVAPKYTVLTVHSATARKNHGNQEKPIPHALSQNLPALVSLPGQHCLRFLQCIPKQWRLVLCPTLRCPICLDLFTLHLKETPTKTARSVCQIATGLRPLLFWSMWTSGDVRKQGYLKALIVMTKAPSKPQWGVGSHLEKVYLLLLMGLLLSLHASSQRERQGTPKVVFWVLLRAPPYPAFLFRLFRIRGQPPAKGLVMPLSGDRIYPLSCPL